MVGFIVGIIFAFLCACSCVIVIVYASMLRYDIWYDKTHRVGPDWWLNKQSSQEAYEVLPNQSVINENKKWEKFAGIFNIDLNKPIETSTSDDLSFKTFTLIDQNNSALINSCLILNSAKELNQNHLKGLLDSYELVFVPTNKYFACYTLAPQNTDQRTIKTDLLDRNNNLTKQAVQSVFPNLTSITQLDHPYLFQLKVKTKTGDIANRTIVDGLKWVYDLLKDKNNKAVYYWNSQNQTLTRYIMGQSEINDLSPYKK